METKLQRIAEKARKEPDFKFTSLYHLMNEELLRECFKRLRKDAAAVSIEAGNVLDGNFPPKQLKMVQAWIEIHKEELLVDWELAVNGDEPFRIAPLQ